MPAKFELIAPCFFGCEATAKFELTRIGAENIRVGDGRLTFAGGPEMIAAANLNLRTVERVMLLLNTYLASTFDELFDGVYSIPWEELLPADAAFPVTGSSLNSQLTSVPACQSIIKKAVVKRLMNKHHTSVLPETGAEYKIRFMLRKNVCEIMLDTTGEGLHKRGYRRHALGAPLPETLAPTPPLPATGTAAFRRSAPQIHRPIAPDRSPTHKKADSPHLKIPPQNRSYTGAIAADGSATYVPDPTAAP